MPIFALLAALAYAILIAFVPREIPASLIVTAVAAMIAARRTVIAPVKPATTLWLGLAFIAYAFLSVLWSDSTRRIEMLRDVALIAANIFIIAAVSRQWSAAFTAALLRNFTVCFIAALAVFAVNRMLNFPLHEMIGSGWGKYPDYMASNVPKRSAALFAVFIWPVALYLWLQSKRKAAIALLAVTTLLSLTFGSRAGSVALFMGLGTAALAYIAPRRARFVTFALIPMALFVTLAFGLDALDIERRIETYIPQSGMYRMHIWEFTARHALHELPFGIGLDGSRTYPQEGETTTFLDGDLLPIHPHNVFLQIWLELGAVGVLLATALLFRGWKFASRQPAAIQPFLYGYAVSAIFVLAIAYGMWQAWWLGGHALAFFLLSLILRTKEETAL